MPPSVPTLIALLHGPDQPGIVARVAGWIFEQGGNILHADQHRDMEAGVFFQRVEWAPSFAPEEPRRGGPAFGAAAGEGGECRIGEAEGGATAGAGTRPGAAEVEAAAFASFARSLGMQADVASSAARPRVAVFVSKADHCFHDLALRWKAGEFPGELAVIVSNHRDLEPAARGYGLDYWFTPVRRVDKAAAEAAQLEVLRDRRIDLVVLARYMQVLSAEFLAALRRPVINIHHSFLPAFAGGRPYHQAHVRGVKLIGATAHYATTVLDEGPIIQQDVARVTHRHSVDDLIRRGRDLEKLVLAQAVRSHLERRVLVYGNKTVVFD